MTPEEAIPLGEERDVAVILDRCESQLIALTHEFVVERAIDLNLLWKRGWRSDFNFRIHYPPGYVADTMQTL